MSAVRLSRIALSALLALACAREPPSAGPAAHFPQPVHDVGRVVQGTRIEHAFPVENRGGAELRLERLEPARGVVVVAYPRSLPPGGRGAIRLAFDTRGLQGPGEAAVRIHTNDPATPRPVVGFKGRVVPELAFAPRGRLYFFAAPGQGGEERVVLVNHGTRPVAVRQAVSDSVHFRPRVEPLAAGRRWAVVVALDPATPEGKHEGTVTLRTDHPRLSELALPVRALIASSRESAPGTASKP